MTNEQEITEQPAKPEKEPHRIFGSKNPDAPLWKDRVKNPGRPKKEAAETSVLKYVRNVAKHVGWPDTVICRRVVNCMRLMADRYPPVKQVIEVWDSYNPSAQNRSTSLDKACDKVGVDRDEFAALVASAVKRDVRTKAAAIVQMNMERLIQASVDHAASGAAGSHVERIRLLKLLDEDETGGKLPSGAPSKKTEPTPEDPMSRSLDAQLAELDAIENIGAGE